MTAAQTTSSTTSEPEVLLEVSDSGVATLTLNRPKRKNGLNKAMVDQAIAALETIWGDDRCRVVVLTGAGTSFCSGMDLSERILPDEMTFMRRVGHLCTVIHDLPLPVISKVRGGAVGYGANLALCADLVVASDTAVFGEIFAERGLSIDGGGSWLVPRLVGLGRAKEIMFLAARVSGPEAAEMCLVNRCVPDADLDGFVDDWSARLADGPRRALSVIKQQLNASFERSFADAIESEAVGQALSFRSKESREGAKAFFEKRVPDFRSC
ncbi:enoyl-CoA hydratase [Gordonia jinghuaiqii]|uniref:Enoyl-CoA hydratase/isomerase family protein n=1 Tax=Gordonia jinghuaiqii TaxID=2758710 RepID=A0A7D7LUN4_9ACTN|nr:enoyl-CoA hydratase-related protein [Gordonia jinghuaiqii]MCR5980600.1 enoyl-CoA hydratase [Gordonia jinghuaiqii]QMT02657.1 enoyl-CoA hydratase/isomerase family protein [Gordonia jinghuaiqii]